MIKHLFILLINIKFLQHNYYAARIAESMQINESLLLQVTAWKNWSNYVQKEKHNFSDCCGLKYI